MITTSQCGTEAPQKQCFSYIRFSSSKQADGDSLRRQLEIAPRVAKEKGWLLRDDLAIKNLGLSAYKGSNIATIEGIIRAAETGQIPKGTVMILEALDRAWRMVVDDSYEVVRRVLKAGIEIYTDKSGRHLKPEDLNSPFSIMMTVAELHEAFEHSDKLAMRVRKAWQIKRARASEGVVMGKMVPAWVDADTKNNKNTSNEKAAIVKRIFTSYASGKGVRTIMRELNAEKVAPFGKGRQNQAGAWSSTHIRRLLAFRGVMGEYQPCHYELGKDGQRKRVEDGTPVPDYYPLVIEKPLFYKVQELLGRNERTLKKSGRVVHGHSFGRKGNVTNLFTGLVKCACCGSSMVIKQSGLHGGKYAYTSLICYNATRGNGCKYHTIQYSFVERAVLTMLFSKVIPAMSETDSRQEKLTTLGGELRETQRQKAKWVSIIEQSDTVPDVAAMKFNALETRESALKRQIESLSATINDNPLTAWHHVPNTPENRLRLQSILADEIESLTVDAGNRTATLTIKDPECSFSLSWPKSFGTNGTSKNPANIGFNCEGFGKPFLYLDQVLVWKSSQNVKLEDLDGFVTSLSDETTTLSTYLSN